MKKILIIQHYGGVGGSGIGLLTTINALKCNYDVVVYCPKEPFSLAEYYRKLNISVKTYEFFNPSFSYYNGGAPWYTRGFLKSTFGVKKALRDWKEIIDEEKPDAILVNSMVMSWLGFLNNSTYKMVCHVRESLPSRKTLLGRVMRNYLNKFDGVMFISEYDKEYINLTNPCQEVIRDSLVDGIQSRNNFKSNEVENEIIHVLFMGGADRIKGLKTAIKAILKVNSNCVLDIAGHLPDFLINYEEDMPRENFILKKYHSELKLLIKEGLSKQRINIIGYVDTVSDLYDQCDILIFPSTKAHQSRPVIEAGAHRKPVIISDFKNTKENVINEYNGLVFKPNSVKELADKIMELANDKEKRIVLGNNNYANTMKKHLEETIKGCTLNFFDAIL